MTADVNEVGKAKVRAWTNDWNLFIKEALGVTLDPEQQAIVTSVQNNPRTSVVSGTARGKDFVAACCAICFLYLTPKWDKNGILIANTKVALTAPTDRQVKNIMMPEISRLFNSAKRLGVDLPGKLNIYDIRTDNEEWFLTGFKADEHNHEAWSGFHAVNTMFIVTEASGIADSTFKAIEGNLQGNSRILLVFNANTSLGYAAKSQKSPRWAKFRLNSLTAPNVLEKREVIPGQVDYEWVKDKVENWCEPIRKVDFSNEEDDFEFEGTFYRPDDWFRIKVLGKFPKVAEDVLIPASWIEAAQDRWLANHRDLELNEKGCLGVDVAGMGTDSTVYCPRSDNYVHYFKKRNSKGEAEHMRVAGEIRHFLDVNRGFTAFIDTIGEGAGTYSRLIEMGYGGKAISSKNSEGAKDSSGRDLTDITGQRKFVNMRAFLFWAVRDWLDPRNKYDAMLPPGGTLAEEATEIKWRVRSDGKIVIEEKEEIKKRLGYSPDEFDALSLTFYPFYPIVYNSEDIKDIEAAAFE